jgi:hypothetical protein
VGSGGSTYGGATSTSTNGGARAPPPPPLARPGEWRALWEGASDTRLERGASGAGGARDEQEQGVMSEHCRWGARWEKAEAEFGIALLQVAFVFVRTSFLFGMD